MTRRTKYFSNPDVAVSYFDTATVLDLARKFGYGPDDDGGPTVLDLFQGMAPDVRLELVAQGKLRLVQDQHGWYVEGHLPKTVPPY